MIKTDILKKALLESTLKEIQVIEALDYPKVKTDDEYENKIYSVINKSQVKRRHYSKRIAIILAAILVCLSMMMSISAIRIKVIDFVVSIYEKYIALSIDEPSSNYPKTIEKVFKPTYIPDEYMENSFSQEQLTVKLSWNSSRLKIRFYQNVILNDTDVYLDNENSKSSSLKVGNITIYYILKNGEYSIKWINEGYLFLISCPESLEWEEIEKIIMSVEKVSNE